MSIAYKCRSALLRGLSLSLFLACLLAMNTGMAWAQLPSTAKDTVHKGISNLKSAGTDTAKREATPDTAKKTNSDGKKSKSGNTKERKTNNLPDTTRSKTAHRITSIYYEPATSPFGSGYRQNSAPANVDTSLDNFEVYTDQYTLGNTGSPIVPLLFQGQPDPLGFFYGNQYYGTSFYNDTTIRYYNSRAPYLGFLYVSNPKIQEFFNMWYSQNIGQKFNLAFGFKRIRDEGYYTNQGTNLNQITLSFNYHNKRYIAFANVLYDVFELHQNGGIVADSDFFNPNYGNRETMPVNLNAATSMMRHSSVHLKQYYLFAYRKNDSGKMKPRMYISHSITASRQSISFSDPGPLDSAFYHHTFYNSGLLTYDSLHINEIKNDISVGSINPVSPLLNWEAGITNQWARIIIPTHIDSVFSLNIVHACLYDTGKYLYRVQGSGIVEGRSMVGDYQGTAQIGFKPDNLRTLWLKGNISSEHPAFIYNIYEGNNFNWQNNFNKVNLQSLAFVYNDSKWKLNIDLQATVTSNMVYFGYDELPHQYSNAVQIFTASIAKVFTVGKWGWKTVEIYQNVPTAAPLHIPQLVSENSLYYQNYVFHRHMLLRLGIDVYFNTAFYANAYMPVYDQYYLQNQTKIGNYACLDPFVSFRIKTFRMFFKFENAGAGTIEPGYFYGYAVNNPINDMVMRMGLSWDFWN